MNPSRLSRLVLLILAVVALPSLATAAVTIALPFADHAVLQRDAEVPIWGRATPGERVTVTYAGKSAQATANAQGDWLAKLPPLKVGDAASLTISGDKSDAQVVLKDVLVGDVWIASGQSNMQWPIARSQDAEKEIAEANHPAIRFFRVPQKSSTHPRRELEEGKWELCTPETAKDFSAVAYFFARELRQAQGVPIGIIQNAWGGMPVESFMSEEAIQADEEFHVLLEKRAAAATQEVKGPSGQPRPENAPQWATNIYNAMVSPLVPYAIKGAIWYQGESNAGRAEQYRKLFPAMIRDWRKQWGQGDFPFLFVQLANFGNKKPRPTEPDDSAWAELREAQALTLQAVPNARMAVIIDIGESGDIHPRNKQDVGKRLALAARAIAYGERDLPHSGPIFREVQFDADKARVHFDHANGLKTSDGQPPKGFQIAGEDQKWHWAEARIDGQSVILSSPQVSRPVAVRYAWADDPEVNLANGAGLPAGPFRTDDWPMITAGKR